MSSRFYDWLLGVSLLSNAVLAVLLAVKLDVSPARLMDHFEKSEARRDLQMAELVAAQAAVLSELDARGAWMTSQSEWRKELEGRTDDRFRLHQFNVWAKQQGLPEIAKEHDGQP